MFFKLLEALKESGLSEELIKSHLVVPKDTKNGDFTLPCFIWSKEFKKSPKDCAEEIKNKLVLPEEFEKVENINGYLNFYLDKIFLINKTITDIKNSNFYKPKSKKIILDYSSPNIAKSLHVGHFRNTAIGSFLNNFYKFIGYEVISINHLGDWGTQFGFVYAGCQIWGKPEAEIDALVDVYRKATIASKEQIESNNLGNFPDIAKIAKDYFIRLEAGEKDAKDFWQWCLDISLDYLKDIYKELNVHFDHYIGESFFQNKLDSVKVELEKHKILESSRDALGVDLGELGFARIFTDDGRSLYLTRDIATAFYREKTFNPDEIIYVVGAPQTLHFQQLVKILEKINSPISKKIHVQTYGHVPGISTRKGNGFTFKSLLDEAQERAYEKIKEQDNAKEISKAVGIGSLFFNFLNRSNIKDFHFVWEDALNFIGDTGPYAQYAYARLCGIEKNAVVKPNLDPNLLLEPESLEIINILKDFNNVLEKTHRDCEPCYVCQFTLNLTKTLSSSYKQLRVSGVEDNLASARLELFLSAKKVLKICLELIGIPVIERM